MTSARLQALAALLAAIARPAMVVGGLAVQLRGRPRATLDADVTVEAEPEDVPDLVRAARKAGFIARPDDPVAFAKKTWVLPLARVEDGWEVDLILAWSPFERQAIGRARPEVIAGTKLPVATAEDLLVHKILAGRPRDLEDAAAIVRRSGDHLDRVAVRTTLLELAEALADDDLARRTREIVAKEGP